MKPVNYRPQDQYARFEAARAYIKAALEIVQEAANYERRNTDDFNLLEHVGALEVSIDNSLTNVEVLLNPIVIEEQTSSIFTSLDEPFELSVKRPLFRPSVPPSALAGLGTTEPDPFPSNPPPRF